MSESFWLLLLLFVIVIVFILIIIWAIITYEKNVKNNGGTPTPYCNDSQTDLVSIESSLQCYANIDDECLAINQYYIGQSSSSKYDYVVTDYNIPALSVCSQYCTSYTNNVCTGEPQDINNFNACMVQLNPSVCIPPLPLAINQTGTLYYAFSPTICSCLNSSCQNPCEDSGRH